MASTIGEKAKKRKHAAEFTIVKKGHVQFRSYCCNINSGGIMGVAKEPVPVIDIHPNPLCLGEDVLEWDLTGSYAPGSTITHWEIDFGDGESEEGADIGAASGSHEYEEADDYIVTVTIEEGLGKDQEVEYFIRVQECEEELNTARWTYVSTDGHGVFFMDWEVDPPLWIPRNRGLSTGGGLAVRHLVIDPRSKTKASMHTLWAATSGGVFTTNSGGQNWTKKSMPDPPNTCEDEPAPVAEDLDWRYIVFDPNNPAIIYIWAELVEAARIWIYKTENNGASWEAWVLALPEEEE